MTMKFQLRPATPSDANDLTKIYLSAFTNDQISQKCFPRSLPTTEKWWYNSILTEMRDSTSHFICIYDALSPTQEIISFAKWNDSSAPIPTKNDIPVWPPNSNEELADHFFGTLIERRREIMRGRKYWYLELVATKPGWQGKGAAGRLIRWGLERADQEGVETYLEASPVGRGVYEYFGFEERGRLVIPLGDGEEYGECMMVRSGRGEMK